MKEFKKWHLVFFAIFLIAFLFLRLWQFRTPNIKVELKGQILNVMLARTPEQRFKGLSDREDLGEYDGMIFVNLSSSKPIMVMRDMKFPIDIVWFDNGEVVDIAKNLQPENVPEAELTRYYPRVEANVVFELLAGWSDKNGLKIGDKIMVIES